MLIYWLRAGGISVAVVEPAADRASRRFRSWPVPGSAPCGGAAMIVASTAVPSLSVSPLGHRCSLIRSMIDFVRPLASRGRRNFSSVGTLGAPSRDRSMPTNSQIAWLAQIASSRPALESPKHRSDYFAPPRVQGGRRLVRLTADRGRAGARFLADVLQSSPVCR